jgi:hypothetical protein
MNRYQTAVLPFVALLLGACAGAQMPSAAAPAAAADVKCPVGYPDSAQLAHWKERVEAAQAMTDSIQKRDAMVELVREALGPDVDVRLAGNVSPMLPHPDDYVPFPAVNFDMNLGDKRDSSTAYYFSVGGTAYVILGPGALHIRGPITTQHNAAHENYHARHHIGDSRPMLDRELEVWTHVFTTTFHHDYPYRMLWNPLISSYEGASPAEQQITLHTLLNYYNSPPQAVINPACVPDLRSEFAGWVSRRINDERTVWKKLVNDLNEELQLGLTKAAPEGVN